MRSISSWPLATKLAALVATLLTLALASIGLTLWITWQLDGGAAAINEAGRMRMQTYRVALLLRDSPSQVSALAHQFDESLTLLEKGDPFDRSAACALDFDPQCRATGATGAGDRQLTGGLARVERGDFGTRVEVGTQDEFGELSTGFNRMAQNLQQLYAGLEQKVSEKTASLETERSRLAALYEVSAFLANASTLDALAQGFAQRVRRIAAADSVAIRWSGEANERYLLLAGDSLPRFMAEDEQCLTSRSCLCGHPQSVPGARVIPVLAAGPGAATLGHCARAGYATLVSVPVILHQRTLGEIDLFFSEAIHLSAQDRDLLDTLASHLAGAMENLRVQLLRDALPAPADSSVARIVDELDAGVRESTGDVRELLMHFRTRGNT
ncbi:hypothetical protein KCU90_g2650, partial [Aureobasidium melanogenum]